MMSPKTKISIVVPVFGDGFDMPINSSPDIPISILVFSFFLFILALVKTRNILNNNYE